MAASPGKSRAFSLSKAAASGAIVGPFIILLNLYFGGRLTTVGFANLIVMLLGGVLGGVFLFVAIACLSRFLGRRAS